MTDQEKIDEIEREFDKKFVVIGFSGKPTNTIKENVGVDSVKAFYRQKIKENYISKQEYWKVKKNMLKKISWINDTRAKFEGYISIEEHNKRLEGLKGEPSKEDKGMSEVKEYKICGEIRQWSAGDMDSYAYDIKAKEDISDILGHIGEGVLVEVLIKVKEQSHDR